MLEQIEDTREPREIKREIVEYCSNGNCGKPIYEGDEYLLIGRELVCMDCVDKTSKREILEDWLCMKIKPAI